VHFVASDRFPAALSRSAVLPADDYSAACYGPGWRAVHPTHYDTVAFSPLNMTGSPKTVSFNEFSGFLILR
jgi:hypothetical protein